MTTSTLIEMKMETEEKENNILRKQHCPEEIMQMQKEINLEYFRQISDYDIFPIVNSQSKDPYILGMEFKSLYYGEQLYAGALDVSNSR